MRKRRGAAIFSILSFFGPGDRKVLDDGDTDEMHDQQEAVHHAKEVEGHVIKIYQENRQAERKDETCHECDQGKASAELIGRLPPDHFQCFSVASCSLATCGAKVGGSHSPMMQREISRRDHQSGRRPEWPVGRTGVRFGQHESAERWRIQKPQH